MMTTFSTVAWDRVDWSTLQLKEEEPKQYMWCDDGRKSKWELAFNLPNHPTLPTFITPTIQALRRRKHWYCSAAADKEVFQRFCIHLQKFILRLNQQLNAHNITFQTFRAPMDGIGDNMEIRFHRDRLVDNIGFWNRTHQQGYVPHFATFYTFNMYHGNHIRLIFAPHIILKGKLEGSNQYRKASVELRVGHVLVDSISRAHEMIPDVVKASWRPSKPTKLWQCVSCLGEAMSASLPSGTMLDAKGKAPNKKATPHICGACMRDAVLFVRSKTHFEMLCD